MQHIFCLCNSTAVPKKPKKNQTAAQDTVYVILTAQTVPSSEKQKKTLTSTATRPAMHVYTFSTNITAFMADILPLPALFYLTHTSPQPCQKPRPRVLLTSYLLAMPNQDIIELLMLVCHC